MEKKQAVQLSDDALEKAAGGEWICCGCGADVTKFCNDLGGCPYCNSMTWELISRRYYDGKLVSTLCQIFERH